MEKNFRTGKIRAVGGQRDTRGSDGDVYLEWHRSRRREKYQMEQKRAHGVCSLEALGGNVRPAIPGGYWENTPEEHALDRLAWKSCGKA